MRNSSFSTSLPRLSCSRLHRYYSGLRLPALRLASSLFGCLPYHAVTLHEENAGSPTVDASLLCCMNGSFRHRRAHTSSPLTSICVLTSAQATASSLGYVGLSMLNSHPYSHAVYASQDYVTASHAKLALSISDEKGLKRILSCRIIIVCQKTVTMILSSLDPRWSK